MNMLAAAASSSSSSKKATSSVRSLSPRPAFSQAAFVNRRQQEQATKNTENKNKTKKFRQGSGGGGGGDSSIAVQHQERIRTAGRVGTKRYVNPCKVFLGNLPYNVTETQLTAWICEQMGLPRAILIHDVNLVRDWKTGQSKGYAFCTFTEAVYATVCIDKCHNQNCYGRFAAVRQGRKKQQVEVEYYLQNQRKAPTDAQEAAIESGILEAEGQQQQQQQQNEQQQNEQQQRGRKQGDPEKKKKKKEKKMKMDPEEVALLRRLDPDLIDDDDDADDEDGDGVSEWVPVDDENDVVDYMIYFDDDNDDNDVDDDGIQSEGNLGDVLPFESDDSTDSEIMMNREQRRDAQRRKKRHKLPHKGFQSP